MAEHYIDVEWTPLVKQAEKDSKSHNCKHAPDGSWDIVASFSAGDEVILEQMMDLDTAKVMILDYYSPLYAHKAMLSIRRRMRPFKTKADRNAERRMVEIENKHWEGGC